MEDEGLLDQKYGELIPEFFATTEEKLAQFD